MTLANHFHVTVLAIHFFLTVPLIWWIMKTMYMFSPIANMIKHPPRLIADVVPYPSHIESDKEILRAQLPQNQPESGR